MPRDWRPRADRCLNCGEPIHRQRNSFTEWTHDEDDVECFEGAVPAGAARFTAVTGTDRKIHYRIDDNTIPLCGQDIVPSSDGARTTCVPCMNAIGGRL